MFDLNRSINPQMGNFWIVPLLHLVTDMRKISLNAVSTCSSSSPPPPPSSPSSPTGATFRHDPSSFLVLPSLGPDPRKFASNF